MNKGANKVGLRVNRAIGAKVFIGEDITITFTEKGIDIDAPEDLNIQRSRGLEKGAVMNERVERGQTLSPAQQRAMAYTRGNRK